ncbi:MAG: peroxiredoxin family protein [Ktedonobacteraceae bacterium]
MGVHAPSFATTDDEGNVVRLDDFAGKKRILTFVLPGCSSCAGAIQTLNTFLQTKPAETVLLIGSGDHLLNRAYASEHDAHLPLLTPSPDFDADLYHIRGVPFVFVLDERGTIRAKGVVNDSDGLQRLLVAAFAPVHISH